MPTLAAGSPDLSAGPARLAPLRAKPRPSRAHQGFTLLELLVVLAIVAVASAGVALTLRDNTASTLERDAQRLAAVLESARAQSRMQGTPVLWRATPRGFVLEGLNPPLPPQPWLSADTSVNKLLHPVNAITAPDPASAALTLGPEPLLQAQGVVLAARSQPDTQIQLASDGLRPFAIVPLGTPLGQQAP
jgi:general secretion pathway protein H